MLLWNEQSQLRYDVRLRPANRRLTSGLVASVGHWSTVAIGHLILRGLQDGYVKAGMQMYEMLKPNIYTLNIYIYFMSIRELNKNMWRKLNKNTFWDLLSSPVSDNISIEQQDCIHEPYQRQVWVLGSANCITESGILFLQVDGYHVYSDHLL